MNISHLRCSTFSIISIVGILLSASCSKPKIYAGDVLLTDADKSSSIAEVYTVEEWIHLENDVDCAIKNTIRIIETGGLIYILEQGFHDQVLVFDSNGKFVKKIGVVGQGPGEYSGPIDFAVDSSDGSVTILTEPSTAYKYDADNRFIMSKKLDETLLHHIAHGPKGFVASTDHLTYTEGEHAYLLYWFDNDLNFLGKAIKVLDIQMPQIAFRGQLASLDDKVIYNDYFTNRVYDCTSPGASDTLLSYSYAKQMPLEMYLGMNYFDNQRNYDHTLSVIDLKDGVAINSFLTGSHNVFIVGFDGDVKSFGSVVMPMETYNGTDGTLLSPIQIDEYYHRWHDRAIKQPDHEPDPEDNMMIMRWKFND